MFVFFFKQKTAYEMRISDWSSDVCSSDLWRSWGLGDVVRDDYTRNIPQGTSAIATGNLGWDLLALGEQGTPPIAMDPFTLETKGIVGWSNKLSPGLHELRSAERRVGKECVSTCI